MINRRSFLSTAIAASATPAFSAVSSGHMRPLQDSLVFSFAPTSEPARQIRFRTASPGEIAIKIVTHHSSHTTQSFTLLVHDADLLDRFYVQQSAIIEADIPLDPTVKDVMFWLVRGGNRTAKITRRGFGNHIIVHPDHVEPLRTAFDGASRSFHFHGREWMPTNEAFVFYKGNSLDAPGVIFGNGKAFLNEIPTGDKFAYGKRIVFTN